MIAVANVLVWIPAFINMIAIIAVDVWSALTLTDADIVAVPGVVIALIPAPDLVDIIFDVVASTLILALAGSILARTMAGATVDVLLGVCSNNFIANMTALEFSFPTPSKEFSSSATIDS